jgi:predicted HAD superfamily Cof-like phosphohydrolase
MTAKAMSEAMLPVISFHTQHAVPMRATPGIPPDDRVRLRARLLVEELGETLAAMFDEHRNVNSTGSDLDSSVAHALDQLQETIDHAPVRVDLVSFADGLADLQYVTIGAALEFGIPHDRCWAEVCASNATKGDGTKRVDGKIGKGPSYRAPDIRSILFPCSPPPLRQEVPTLTPEIATPRDGIYFGGARLAPRYTWEQPSQPYGQAERK